MRLNKLANELGIKCTELIKIGTDLGMRNGEDQKDLSNFVSLSEEEVNALRKAHGKSKSGGSDTGSKKQEKPSKEKKDSSKKEAEHAVKADSKKPSSDAKKKKKKKKKSVYVFDNPQAGSAYSSDQRGAYVPKPIRQRRGEAPKPTVVVEEQDVVSVDTPQKTTANSADVSVKSKVAETKHASEKGGESGVKNEKASHDSKKPAQKPAKQGEKEGKQNPESLIGQIVKPVERPSNAGRAPASKSDGKGKGKKKQPKVIIGTISNADYSRPMPMGRPSSSAGKRKPAEGRKPAPGRPGAPSRRNDDKRRGGGGAPSWKRKEAPVPVEEEITKSGSGKRRGHGQKKKDAPIDRDRLDKKAKNKKKLSMEYGRGEFDFGKKRKQKALKYKEKQIKEKSEKLDEMLQKQTVYVPEEITVKEFAEKINKNVNEIIMKLVKMGKMLTINNLIDFEDAALIAIDYNIDLDVEVEEEIDYAEQFDLAYEDEEKHLVERAPVVTVMGHVDHGKTSLLDAIRNTGVADGEAGGITQHIGASEIIKNDKKILFLDTPGHEAFSTLRARGAQITDIAILVVAADDGVMPQTIEAIDHAKAAGVPLIVAINKIDKPAANPNRVKQELSEKGVIIEEWGGDVIAVPVSAKTGEGIDQLLDMILIVAEVQDLKANPDRAAVGTVIDAKVVKGRGTVATVLIEKGTINQGDNFVAGRTYGRIKTMFSSHATKIKHSGPSSCVEIDGISDIPHSGEKFYVTPDEKTAKQVAEKYDIDHRRKTLRSSAVRLEQLFDKIKDGSVKELCMIIKADVQGSVEALKTSLQRLSTEEVKVNIIRAEVGAISESDVILASASNALIIGFNVRPSTNVSNIADSENVDIRTYNIIYQVIDDVENALKGMLDPIFKEVVVGKAEVRDIFKIPGGMIAGSYVTSGKIARNAGVRVIREGIVLFTGKIASLRRFKDDVREVASGYECGIGIEKYTDIKEGDELEAFIMEEIKR